VDAGLIRHLGVSNLTIPKLRLVLRDARITPALHEMELHPAFQQGELYQFSKDAGMVGDRLLPDGIAAPSRARQVRRRRR